MSIIGPFFALLIAATLLDLAAYLSWSSWTPLTTVRPHDFGPLRWLGTALAAVFTIVWLPLFPGSRRPWPGMVACTAVLAVIGYALLASYMRITALSGCEPSGAALALVLLLVVLLVWMPIALRLSHRTRLAEVVRQGRRPLRHAVWSGALLLCLTAMGTEIFLILVLCTAPGMDVQ